MSRSKWKAPAVFQKSKTIILPKDVSSIVETFVGKEKLRFKILQPMVGHNFKEFSFKKRYSYFHRKFFTRND